MASNYTGDPTAAESPSPAPSLGETTGGDPIGNLPADGDALNASSVIQALRVPLDWIAFFRRQGYGWTDIGADVTVSRGSGFGFMRTISNMVVIVAGATGLTYEEGLVTMSIAGSHLSGTMISLATGTSTDIDDDPFYCSAKQTSLGGQPIVYNVAHRLLTQGATGTVRVLILGLP